MEDETCSDDQEIWQERMRPVKDQICQYLMWRKSRPENKISAEVEEKVENAIQVSSRQLTPQSRNSENISGTFLEAGKAPREAAKREDGRPHTRRGQHGQHHVQLRRALRQTQPGQASGLQQGGGEQPSGGRELLPLQQRTPSAYIRTLRGFTTGRLEGNFTASTNK